MLKARGKLISLLTACMALVLMLVMGITTLSIQPKVASAADTEITFALGANGSASHNDSRKKEDLPLGAELTQSVLGLRF